MRVALLCCHVFALSGLIAATNEGNASDGNASDGNTSAVSPTPAPLPGSSTQGAAAGANGSNTSNESNANESNESQESMPASAGAATAEGSAEATNGIAENWALDAVRPASWSTGRVSAGVIGVGVVTVALGGLAAALSVRRGHSPVPVGMEDDLLVE